jgi:hypothetical protein
MLIGTKTENCRFIFYFHALNYIVSILEYIASLNWMIVNNDLE